MTNTCASRQCRHAPSAANVTNRRKRSINRRWARRFHPIGIRRDIGFQAVTSTASRTPCRRSNASMATERRPIRNSSPSTE